MDYIENVIDKISKTLNDTPPTGSVAGQIVRDGFDSEIDELRGLVEHGHDWLNNYTQKLIDETKISTLKIKFTQVSGYFIEIPLSQKSKVPEYFKQTSTLVNALRYTTSDLAGFETKILTAEQKLTEREGILFLQLCDEIFDSYASLKQISQETAKLDFHTNLAWVALKNNYTKPQLHEGYDLSIVGGRHAVIEQIEKEFVSNELSFDKKHYISIITGPNMGGKSTYLRQNALIVLLAHIGSFVPAKSAFIPITDKIFSRVGASDHLAIGSSTFMVEMQEVANILNNATQKSFVIIDEVGRGTSTYDGMSLAWAILRFHHDQIKAKTLFATHYHELVDESKKLPGVKNFCVAVSDNEDNIVFLRKIVPGSIKKSYGIEVARLAGLPLTVLSEANLFLKHFENTHSFAQLTLGAFPKIEEKIVYRTSPLDQALQALDLNNLTPLQALEWLHQMKDEKGKSK